MTSYLVRRWTMHAQIRRHLSKRPTPSYARSRGSVRKIPRCQLVALVFANPQDPSAAMLALETSRISGNRPRERGSLCKVEPSSRVRPRADSSDPLHTLPLRTPLDKSRGENSSIQACAALTGIPPASNLHNPLTKASRMPLIGIPSTT